MYIDIFSINSDWNASDSIFVDIYMFNGETFGMQLEKRFCTCRSHLSYQGSEERPGGAFQWSLK